ncbi:MAG: HAD family phosphatase [Lachnospiraceae bacterium]|nr:HAD family phosphatase [Lachnospiraceae bacterium]
MIQNVIFDIGNVLTDFRWRDFLRDKGFSEEMIARIAKVSTENVLWRELDRGVWSWEKLIRAFIAEDPEIEEELHKAFDDMQGIVTIRDYAIPWVKELKEKGCQVWYLSNFSEKIQRECRDALAFLPYMDGGILSYQEQLIKPDREIYELLLGRYGLQAEDCVFIDDTPANIEAAKELGIHGIVFQTREQVRKELSALL